jgi:hypothetical protein
MLISITRSDPPTQANVEKLRVDLTALIADHVNAKDPWTFYEQIDQFLGPWGDKGYPLSYGKFYCQLFNRNQKLQENLDTRDWVAKTTVKLQELIRDKIIDLFKNKKLASLTEDQFRAFAFATHPQAYDQGGLALVVLIDPEMLPVIILIPSVEFIPGHGNALSTWVQVLDTLLLLSRTVPGYVLAASAGPAHNLSFQKAMSTSGMNAILAEQRQNAWYETQFGRLKTAIQTGRLDRITWLDGVTNKLKVMSFADPYWRDVARQTVADAESRKSEIADFYVSLLHAHPEMRAAINQTDPTWTQYTLRSRTCPQ